MSDLRSEYFNARYVVEVLVIHGRAHPAAITFLLSIPPGILDVHMAALNRGISTELLSLECYQSQKSTCPRPVRKP